MKPLVKKILLGTLAVPCLALAGFVGTAQLRWDRTFEAPYPEIRASSDSAVVARGSYLVNGPAHCSYCHTTTDQWPALDSGAVLPLTGGNRFVLPVGTFITPNLTPDVETGIGRRSDAELARMLRHSVRADGRAALPFMPFQNMSDDDLTAIISYLRSREPVRHEVPNHDLTMMGKGLMAFLIEPQGPEGTPPQTSPAQAPTIARGKYLANSVANCAGCHTKRSPMDGSAIGEPFAGGMVMEDEKNPDKIFVTPNLTPDAATGRIAHWTEEQFVARFRVPRKAFEGSHMPWMAFRRMSDDDVRAIYRYLNSLSPVANATGPSYQDKPAD
ncbi:Cytochrome c, mono-and diheme variants [Catalinimonas alkaloidigena]|uniref:Cytochrome c, mono-and diheme variants n=1 Tax=Catalinimonas alkaloidigena TaxID=1075417 RepID=A0A1G9GGU2_9BACT|nr:c-type cytochrome [Catalinimonas alkaloidigena]SDK99745.1 Cytochrome c, mono-and diheme variants [Catalinimonas alkaloidigena]